MTSRLVAALLLALAILAGPAALAQVDSPVNREEVPDLLSWESVVERAELAIDNRRASTFAFEQLRNEIAGYRTRFEQAQGQNSARIATLEQQIEALGEPPEEGGSEPEAITERRAELRSRLNDLMAPVRLANETYVQANGLIGEIDALIRMRQTRSLAGRGPMPLNPTTWGDGVLTLQRGIATLASETKNSISNEVRQRELFDNLPAILIFVVVATVLLMRGRLWMRRLNARVNRRGGRSHGVLSFLLSTGKFILPSIGLLALFTGIIATGLVGVHGEAMLPDLLGAGILILFTRWLGEHYFPSDGEGRAGPLEFGELGRMRARFLANLLGWAIGLETVLRSMLSTIDSSPEASAVVMFPAHLLTGFALFQFGRILARPISDTEEDEGRKYRGRIISTVGRIATLAGVATPLLAALGYEAAAEALGRPMAMTLGVFGVVLLLQRLVYDIYILITNNSETAENALLPVLVAMALALIALPILILIWGARVADLTEAWTRFREGFTVGDTTLSPRNVLIFAAVFAGGYVLTRIVQGALRATVLPKTRLDVGGQNAVAVGIGYLGIMIAAIFAITSAGIDMSNFALVASALTVGIGFGLQNIVSNFISGIILLVERPIGEGDWIQVGDQMGYVRDISVRSTRIETFDRTDVIVPNADLVSNVVTNWTRGNNVGRIIVPVGVAYGTDTEMVSDVLLSIARQHPMVLHNPEPYVFFKGFGDSSLDFEIRAILRDVNWILSVQTEMNHAIARRFAEEGIEIPFPQRDIWVRSKDGAGSDARSTQGPHDNWEDTLKGDQPDVVKGEDI
ncbi:DUF3772 domain-containing protein [Pelagovum pacificum]|uniref:Mechanosensitive ion channel family protein n=1 Tax=Pelagovum pacificum TaxID=2588711 RepID=A0A5C5G7X9_9RHOB|nr:DUF3772 domain-containing protein [Pelagovum pacificum]QQA41529.1 mechanosensitive ion channel family protein [Pelagovum pacificum]TNY30809.1 mechanosensitive ion channel family protein [Pelagovum pacificum]